MRKRSIAIIIILLAAAFVAGPGSDAPLAASGTAVVSGETLNIRSGPGLSHDITGSLRKGDRLTVTGSEGDWLRVESGAGNGWVASWLTTGRQGAAPAASVISQVDRLNVRAQPSTSAAVLSKMNKGDGAVSYGTSNGWTEIEWNGERGWVASRYITESAEQESGKPEPAAAKGGQFTVSVGALVVRKGPDQSTRKAGVIRKGESYPVIGQEHNWVLLSLGGGKEGWVYSFHGTLSDQAQTGTAKAGNPSGSGSGGSVTVLYDGTNVRSQPSTSGQVVARASAGQTLTVLGAENDWYRVSLADGTEAFVAGWVVSSGDGSSGKTDKTAKPAKRKPGTLKGLTIVVDAGHGGNDRGTTGIRGTDEKDLTLPTAELLAAKLSAAGADVIMSRDNDRYVGLRKRVAISNQTGADAFISLHYDATHDHSVDGFTTYYLNRNQLDLAEAVHSGLAGEMDFRNRGVQKGNFLVLRENRQPAILIELGFLSNLSEERRVADPAFREKATDGIYRGLIDYFDAQLKN
ncbi:SH3 domain-containing protein [Edaphobacillus lindanitolerans]|uniref:N-acetylmuramoyl-L-alanine amidase n=1 Tax=Edaphobacillus lindanitolerans TaxID=550447 RepID=A0A1U7PLY5_9BACI|nr:N-acetylmuramoyl-L-alanine amidase [Edaphobacillus lindanitolerans]SIT82816.1 N-acetylmuramoyl-L-alanine amidase [Edaphobacillus lindanitolerans]